MPYKDQAAQLAYQKRWMANRRKQWLAANGPCVRCGSWDHLEVDHIDPKTKVHHAVWSWIKIKVRMDADLAKCRVLCNPCHKKRHPEETRRHGTGGYRRWCRCDVCIGHNRERYIRARMPAM